MHLIPHSPIIPISQLQSPVKNVAEHKRLHSCKHVAACLHVRAAMCLRMVSDESCLSVLLSWRLPALLAPAGESGSEHRSFTSSGPARAGILQLLFDLQLAV